MQLSNFKVEEWMNIHENDAKYNLGETCVDSMTIKELIELSGENVEDYCVSLANMRMTYGDILGSSELLSAISGLYSDIAPTQILTGHGAIGANYQVTLSLVSTEDNIVVFSPSYPQFDSLAASIGAEVRYLPLKYEDGFIPDIELLKSIVDDHTKLIAFNNPNNPTGTVIREDVLKQISDVAKSVNAYVLSDEVYRGITDEGQYAPSIVDFYSKGISTGSMSKVFSLAGLRLGWIVTKDEELLQKCISRRDYDIISMSSISETLALLALENKEKILKRNRNIVCANRTILNRFVHNNNQLHFVAPTGGTTALVFYNNDIPSIDFSTQLLNEMGVLVVPGIFFGAEQSVRIGYAFDQNTFKESLDLIDVFCRIIEYKR